MMTEPYSDAPDTDGADDDAEEKNSDDQQQATTPNEAKDGEQSKPDDDKPDDQDVPIDELPERWQNEIRRLRSENAKKRETNRDLDDSTDALNQRVAVLESELEEQRVEAKQAQDTAEKTQILADRGLDKKYLPMLSGDKEKDWEASADSLVELRGTKGATPDPVQASASNRKNEGSDNERAAEAFFSGLT